MDAPGGDEKPLTLITSRRPNSVTSFTFRFDGIENEMILADFPLLVEDLSQHTEADTRVILVKANICELLEPLLIRSGFAVLNRGQKVPFPIDGASEEVPKRGPSSARSLSASRVVLFMTATQDS